MEILVMNPLWRIPDPGIKAVTDSCSNFYEWSPSGPALQ